MLAYRQNHLYWGPVTLGILASPDVVPIDVSAQVDRSLWIALLARDTADLAELAGRTLFLGVAFDEQLERSFPLE